MFFHFLGSKCTLRERFMGVNKVKMGVGFDGGLSSWLAGIEVRFGRADSKDAALSTALYN